nr:hypothetical protein [Tanacetum cinerariifolium]
MLMEQMTQLASICKIACQIIQKKQEEKRIEEEQAAKAKNSNIPVCYDDDDDHNSAITPNKPSFSDEDILKKIYSNSLFNEEIISMKIHLHHFNVESDLIESLLNHDSLIISSSLKIDSLFDEFVSELTLLKSIPLGINETDCDLKEENRFIKRLLYDNSSPRPLKEFVSKNSDAAIESFSPSPIPVEDNDSLMEEIDLSFTSDDPMPLGIEENDYDSEGDILILKNCLALIPFHFLKMSHFILIFLHPLVLLQNHQMIDSLFDEFVSELTLLKSIPLGINETDCDLKEENRFIKRLLYDNSSPRPLKEFVSKNSDAAIESFSPSPIPVEDNDSLMEEIDLSFTSDDPMPLGIEENDYDSEGDILILKNCLALIPFHFLKMSHFILIFLHPLVLLQNHQMDKSPDLLPYLGHEAFQPSSECLMMIYGKNTPILDVPCFHFYPPSSIQVWGNLVKLSDPKKALRGRHPMLILSLVMNNLCLLCAIVV